MATPIIVPKLGLTVTEAEVVAWFKKESEPVKKDETMAEVETEKSSMEIIAPEDGVILKIVAPAGTYVPVGSIIGYVGQIGEPIPTSAKAETSVETSVMEEEPRESKERTIPASVATGMVRRISPRAKELATKHEIDVSLIQGSGPDGTVLEKDVTKYIEPTPSKTREGVRVRQVIPMSTTRRAMSESMVSSLREMAQVTLIIEVNASEIEALRSTLSAESQRSWMPTYTEILVKAVANLLQEQPIVNSCLEDDCIKVAAEVNVGVATAVDTGLVVPVIRGANTKKLRDISTTLRYMVDKAKRGELVPDDYVGGTFTITNLGAYGIDAFTPIINPPQVAILGVGKMSPRAVVEDGNIAVKPMMTMSLTFDHRVIDGHVAAEFLSRLKKIIETQATTLKD